METQEVGLQRAKNTNGNLGREGKDGSKDLESAGKAAGGKKKKKDVPGLKDRMEGEEHGPFNEDLTRCNMTTPRLNSVEAKAMVVRRVSLVYWGSRFNLDM